jgi:hypothetical protein
MTSRSNDSTAVGGGDSRKFGRVAVNLLDPDPKIEEKEETVRLTLSVNFFFFFASSYD